MSDWGMGATSKKRSKAPTVIRKPIEIVYSGYCCRCGMFWGVPYDPHTVPGAMCENGFVCDKCRNMSPQRPVCPPPAELERMISKAVKAKK